MKNKKTAFTLVELIVVIVILAILATIGFISLMGYTSKARDIKKKSDIKIIGDALNIYQIKYSELPEPDNKIPTSIEEGGIKWTKGIFGKNAFEKIKTINELPIDSATNTGYIYYVSEDGKDFKLETELESENIKNSNYKTLVVSNVKNLNSSSGDNSSGDNSSGDNSSGDNSSGDNSSGDNSSGDNSSGDNSSGGAECTFNGKTISDGNSLTVYQKGILSYNSTETCNSMKGIVRCSDGVTSGNLDYTYTNCEKKISANCEANPNYKPEGAVKTYNLPALENNGYRYLYSYVDDVPTNGRTSYKIKATCNDGVITSTDETTYAYCITGYMIGNECKINLSARTIYSRAYHYTYEPAIQKTYNEAGDYCVYLGRTLGYRRRLPTESELKALYNNNYKYKLSKGRWLWSTTLEHSNNVRAVYYSTFNKLRAELNFKTSKNYFLCIRY